MSASTPYGADHARRARSFGAVARDYDSYRPSYPTPTVERLLRDGARHVVDLGAGTGALTRVLLGLGVRVTAVEPDPAMLAVLSDRSPEVEALVGSAERIPLPDGSADAVLVAQARHWVDPVPAAAEVRRVLRPGGVLGLLWNVADDRVPWVAELNALTGGGGGLVADPLSEPELGEGFSVRRQPDAPWREALTPEHLLARAGTYSAMLVLDPAARARVERDVRALLARHHPEAATVEVPEVTLSWRAERVAGPPATPRRGTPPG